MNKKKIYDELIKLEQNFNEQLSTLANIATDEDQDEVGKGFILGITQSNLVEVRSRLISLRKELEKELNVEEERE